MFTAIFEAIKAMFVFASKVTPSEKMQELKQQERKELREQDINQKMINDDFAYLKRRTEIDMWDYMRNVHATMSMSEMATHHKILVARVHAYRYDRPVIYRKWIQLNPK